MCRFPHHCKYFLPFARPIIDIQWQICINFQYSVHEFYHDKLSECCKAELTCIILSSDTEQITQGSFGFHEKSDILAVCPPWINKSSGGPSSASSADCSSPILDKSQTCSRRSVPEEAKIVSL